jgi:hypothetical protein
MQDHTLTQNQKRDLGPHTIIQVKFSCSKLCEMSKSIILFFLLVPSGMFLSMSMEEPNEPLACNVDGGGGRRGVGGGAGGGSSRSNDDDSSVSMPESGSSAGSEHNDAPPNGHMAGPMGPSDLPHGLGGHHPPLLGPTGLKRRPISPVDDPRRPAKRPKHGTSTMLLSLMQVLKESTC